MFFYFKIKDIFVYRTMFSIEFSKNIPPPTQILYLIALLSDVCLWHLSDRKMKP